MWEEKRKSRQWAITDWNQGTREHSDKTLTSPHCQDHNAQVTETMSNSLQTSHCNLQCGWQLLTSIACHNPRFSQKTPDYVPFPLTQGEKEKSRGAFLNCFFFFFFFLLSVATTKYITHFSSTSNKTDPPSQHHCKLATSLQTMNLYTYRRVGSVGSPPFFFLRPGNSAKFHRWGKEMLYFITTHLYSLQASIAEGLPWKQKHYWLWTRPLPSQDFRSKSNRSIHINRA